MTRMTTLVAWMVLGLAGEPASINDQVVQFARSKVGQKVGNGDCAALASEALRSAGARRRGPAWGDELPSVAEARPGDVLVFEDTVFVRTRVRRDGAVETLTARSAHHVAIVASVRGRGRRAVLTVLQQNVGFEGTPEAEAKVVRAGTINLAEMKRGTLRVYRPVAAAAGEPAR
jgi:hypothetical protein